MTYLILPVICILFFELLGQTILKMLKIRPFMFNAIVGFVFTLGALYILCFIPIYLHANFRVVLIIFTLITLASLVLIVINIKNIRFTPTLIGFIVMLAMVTLFAYASSYKTIGNINTYDTLSYSNLIGNNIYQEGINLVDMENGYPGTLDGYAYQTYYMLASCLTYITDLIFTACNTIFFYFTQYIWLYSIIFYYLTVTLIINFCGRVKRTPFAYIFILLFVFCFIGSWYWHLYQPFIGNSFRFLLCSYTIMYTRKYSETSDNRYLFMALVILLASSSCSNTNSLIMVVYCFGILCVFKNLNKNSLLLLYALSIIPVLNILLQIIKDFFVPVAIFYPVLILLIVFFGDALAKFFNHKVTKIVLFVLSVLVLISLSLLTTGKIVDLEAYLTTLNKMPDMRWSIINISDSWAIVANFIFIILFIVVIIKHHKDRWLQMLIVISIVFFSPITTNFLHSYNPVWNRVFELVFNYYIIFDGIIIIDRYIRKPKLKALKIVIATSLILCAGYVGYNEFFNSTFVLNDKKEKGYNFWLKMTDDQASALEFTKKYIKENHMENAFVSSSVYQLRSEIPTLKTLFNRTRKNTSTNPLVVKLVYMLYPGEEFYGQVVNSDNYNYVTLVPLMREAKLELLVLEKSKLYHEKIDDSYHPLYIEINGEVKPIYENNSYIVYDLRQ